MKTFVKVGLGHPGIHWAPVTAEEVVPYGDLSSLKRVADTVMASCGVNVGGLFVLNDHVGVTCPACVAIAHAYDRGFTDAAEEAGRCCGCNAYRAKPVNPYSGESVADLAPPPVPPMPSKLVQAAAAASRSLVGEIAVALDAEDPDLEVFEDTTICNATPQEGR